MPVSICRALVAEVIIAINLNGDLLGRRFQTQSEPPPIAPSALRQSYDQSTARGPAASRSCRTISRAAASRTSRHTSRSFYGFATSACWSPTAKEVVAEGRDCVEQALQVGDRTGIRAVFAAKTDFGSLSVLADGLQRSWSVCKAYHRGISTSTFAIARGSSGFARVMLLH